MAKSVLGPSDPDQTSADLIRKSEILRKESQELQKKQRSISRKCRAEIARSRKLLKASERQ